MSISTDAFEISYKPIDLPRVGYNGYDGFHPGKTEILKKGFTNKGWDGTDSKALLCDILLEHDVEIVARDGTKMYGDIYRPAHSDEKVPCILSWSCFGKKYTGMIAMPRMPWNCGVLPSDISGFEKFEGVDPAEFVNWGYAVASVDERGSGNSEGYASLGPQAGRDGYDVVEFLAAQPWCNGSVGMAGNSHLAIVQYFVAAEQPPSLKAIAPWEGCSDWYREQFVRGGIFYMSNFGMIGKRVILGKKGLEDFEAMYERYPLTGPYWDSKRAKMERIKCPVFVKGTDSASMHTMGAIRAWMQIPVKDKWIKWNGYQEWYDLWVTESSRLELKGFFDRFLKGLDNDFVEKTPPCRWTLLRYGDKEPIENIKIPTFPHPDTDYRAWYLSSDGHLLPQPPANEKTLSYNSTDFDDRLEFKLTFDKPTVFLGIPKIYLYMSCPDYDDLVIYVQVHKYDKNGVILKHINVPAERRKFPSFYTTPRDELKGLIAFDGPQGMLRVSQRHIDRSRTYHPQIPFHSHDRVEKIPPGEVVDIEMGIWEMGTIYEAGETLAVSIYGQAHINDLPAAQKMGLEKPRPDHELNHGTHNVHLGGKYPARIILPHMELSKLPDLKLD